MNKIKMLRKKMGLSQIELGKKTEIARSKIYLYENGKGNPTLKTLRKIARALGCRVAELIDDDDE